MDGKLLVKARARLDDIQLQNAQKLESHQRIAYEKVPELRTLERELRTLVTSAAVYALQHGQDAGTVIDGLAARSLELQERRRQLLLGAGLPVDYIDEIYSCKLCQDSGYHDGAMCVCLQRLYQEEVRKSLSSLLKLGDERFENFDLGFYSDVADEQTGVSPRNRMRVIRDYCQLYAEKFDVGADNLLLQGGTGLGKTFLSACIAREVAEKGFSVAYETAVACVSVFETQKFGRGSDDWDAANEQVRRYLGCDLMILDDLGTEMAGGFSTTALYTLINTRLTEGKTTIISTNLTDEELRRRYTGQIASRLEGEYQNLKFLGSDIRKIKKARKLGL